MRITDATARAVFNPINHYMGSKLYSAVENGDPITPQFISVLLRSQRFRTTLFHNCNVQDEEDRHLRNGLSMTAYVSRGSSNCGSTFGSCDEIGYNPEEIGKTVRDKLDDVVKHAGRAYMYGVGDGIVSTNPEHITPLGVRERNVFIEKSSPCEDTKPLIELIKNSVQPIIQEDMDVNVKLTILDEESLFVDSLTSDIRQFWERVTVTYALKGQDSDHRSLERTAQLYFASAGQVTERILRRRIQMLLKEFKAARRAVAINSGSSPVLFDGTATGTMVHEAFAAHLLSGKYVMENDSTVYGEGRLGTQILPDWITVIDNPQEKGGFASYRFDEEGTPAREAILIENGKLNDYLLDTASSARLSRKLGRQIISNGRARSSWVTDEKNEAIAPEPRISNLTIKISEDYLLKEKAIHTRFLEMIRESKNEYGLFVEGGGGEVEIQGGQFKLFPRCAWCADKKGNFELVRDLHLIGSVDSFFKETIAVGLPYRSGFGMCGSDSGYVPTQERAPSFLLKDVTAIASPEDTRTKRLFTY